MSFARAGNLCLMLLLTGCAARPEFAPVDLASADWRVWSGQAIWQIESSAAPIAGDVVVAKADPGRVYATMSKAGLPVFVARAEADGWMLQVTPTGIDRARRGEPPSRFAWFNVPQLLADPESTMPGWTVDRSSAGQLILFNTESGERIQLFLDH